MKKAFASVLAALDKAPLDEEINQIIVVHTDNETAANELAGLVEQKTGVKPRVVIMGPTIGAHVGPGSVSCGWVSKITRNQLTGL